MDVRLQRRYWQLVREHMNSSPHLAAGPKAAMEGSTSFASTQALWRFLANPQVKLLQLVAPLRTLGCAAAGQSPSPYVLLVHDWSKLAYPKHSSKRDQNSLGQDTNVGYELSTALLVEATRGSPLAPMELQLLSARGVHTTRQKSRPKRVHHLKQILPTMKAARQWNVPRQIVHVIDAEADSQGDFRAWCNAGELFLVRSDFTRRVDWKGQSLLLPELVATWHARGLFRRIDSVPIRGKIGRRYVAEGEVLLSRPARKRTPHGRIKVGREPLKLRLVISRVVSEDQQVLAEWYLLTNVGDDVTAPMIANWYYWRWRIETYHKLLKSGSRSPQKPLPSVC